MTRFLGTHKGKLDKKGRISVPADFRGALARTGDQDLVFFPSYKLPCIECWPASEFDAAADGHDGLALFSPDSDDLGGAIFAHAAELRPDAEGRVSLPERHITLAGLTEALLFVGQRRRFQIWDAERGEAYLNGSVVSARDKGLTLGTVARRQPQP